MNPASDYCQRWRHGQHSWRHRSEGGFDRSRYEVAAIPDDTTAKAFVVEHHYSRSFPAAAHRYGLYRAGGLVGCAVLSIPPQAKVLTGIFPDLAPYNESLELGRLVLLDEEPANAESFFLGQAFRLAARAGVAGIVSMSDPMPRRRADGTLVLPGHVGIVYQASNARYCGRSWAEPLVLLPDGTAFNRRTMQKVRKQERGAAGVERKLRDYGASIPRAGESPTQWLHRALDEIGARRVHHAGNHRYAFALHRRVRIALEGRPYPKTIDQEAA